MRACVYVLTMEVSRATSFAILSVGAEATSWLGGVGRQRSGSVVEEAWGGWTETLGFKGKAEIWRGLFPV